METTVYIDRVEITVVSPDKPLFLTKARAAIEVGMSWVRTWNVWQGTLTLVSHSLPKHALTSEGNG